MELPDHNGVGYVARGPQAEGYRPRGPLQRHHTIQTADDAYVSVFVCVCAGCVRARSSVWYLLWALHACLRARSYFWFLPLSFPAPFLRFCLRAMRWADHSAL